MDATPRRASLEPLPAEAWRQYRSKVDAPAPAAVVELDLGQVLAAGAERDEGQAPCTALAAGDIGSPRVSVMRSTVISLNPTG